MDDQYKERLSIEVEINHNSDFHYPQIFKDSGCELPAISLAEFAGLHKALADKESFASRNYWWRLLGLGEDHALATATLRTLYDGTVKVHTYTHHIVVYL